MGYKIFYSYQSDIKKNLNQNFIRDAINIATSKLTQYNIEPLREGFYGTGGNPPLLDTMLEQSEGSDIFIGDITFTSSKIWQSQGVGFSEDAKTYLIEIDKPIDLKPAPNPNVLIETGFSWALKKFKRTILVFNETFGNPSELPVDMKGLRWPITYNLSETKALKTSKYKKELNKLSSALEKAIADAITSSIEYQIKHWSPMVVHSQWKNDHKYTFHITPLVKIKINELRNKLINYIDPVRITGLMGCGKTRLVLEVFQKNGDLDYHPMNEQIIYHDYYSVLSGDISRQLAYLKRIRQQKVLIVDNCNFEEHNKLVKHFRDSQVKLVTISTTNDVLDTDGASIFIDESITKEIFESIIQENFQSNEASIIINKYEWNLDKFVKLMLTGINEAVLNKSFLDQISNIVGDENIKKGVLKLLVAVSLFEEIGVSGSFSNELEFVGKHFVNCTNEEIHVLVEVLESRNLVIRKGDFIISSSYREELILHWENESINDVNNIVKKIIADNTLNRILEKLFDVITRNKTDKYIKVFNDNKGLLKDNEFIESNEGSLLLQKLSADFPILVINILSSQIQKI